MKIDEVLAAIEADRHRHMTAEPATEPEMEVVEATLGRALPDDFRTLLARLGGGLLYDRHEVFGARRLLIHDVELVPDLLSFRRRFVAAGGGEQSQDFLPFHRADGVVHLIDLRAGDGAAVVSLDGARRYADLSRFLEEVVLPTRAAAVS